MSSSATYGSFDLLSLNGAAGAASFFALALAWCISVVVSAVMAVLLIVKFIQLRKFRNLKGVPCRWEPLPYVNLLSLRKSCSQGGPTWLSASLFAAVVGFHHIYKKQGMHMFFIGTTPSVSLQKAEFVEEVLSSSSLLAKGPEYELLHNWLGTGLLTRLGELFLLRMLNPFFSSEYIFKHSSMGKEYYDCLNTLHTFTRKVIEERKKLLQKQNHLEDQTDVDSENVEQQKRKRPLLDLLLTEHLRDSASINEEDIREEVDTFMFEGHDTTAMGISWALFLIGHHPAEQQKIHDELDAIFGSEKHRPVTAEDLREMKYLESCIKEAQRLYPSVSFMTRTCEAPFQIGTVTFPVGTIVRVPVYCLHRDENVFPKPEEFQPERFFPENAKGRHPFAYIPFSAGPRNCIGQKFALSEEKIVIANILRRFKLKSLDQRDEVNVVSEMVLRPKSGLRIQFTPR
ncbi:cytochrome P450 4c3-like isoform X2 [Dermacentor variabilis]|uniref:cytochrome P450 4c3-like isoform X2 n=1 Tax=Dermacentor variabilis TaxID=34621 RepID=UPI003F5CBB8E